MIYFLRAGDHVKIGWSRDGKSLDRRLRTLQTGQPFRLEIMRTVERDRWAEGWLHGFFSGLRLAGEWFCFREDMLTVEVPSEKPLKPPKIRQPLKSGKPEIRPNGKRRKGRGMTLDPDQLDVIRARIEALAPSRRRWALDNGLAPAYVEQILRGDRPPSDRVLDALGLRLTLTETPRARPE